jgi:hypothetical protein
MGSIAKKSVNTRWYTQMVEHGLKQINANKKGGVEE